MKFSDIVFWYIKKKTCLNQEQFSISVQLVKARYYIQSCRFAHELRYTKSDMHWYSSAIDICSFFSGGSQDIGI